MTEGTKNTVLGATLTAILGGLTWIIASTSSHGQHLVRIDTVIEQNQAILKDIQSRSGSVPPLVEAKLDELRNRLNLHDQRLNLMDQRKL